MQAVGGGKEERAKLGFGSRSEAGYLYCQAPGVQAFETWTGKIVPCYTI